MRHENQARIGKATFHSQSKVFRKSSSTTENVRVLLCSPDGTRTHSVRYCSAALLPHARNKSQILSFDDLYCVPGGIRTQGMSQDNLLQSCGGDRIRTSSGNCISVSSLHSME